MGALKPRMLLAMGFGFIAVLGVEADDRMTVGAACSVSCGALCCDDANVNVGRKPDEELATTDVTVDVLCEGTTATEVVTADVTTVDAAVTGFALTEATAARSGVADDVTAVATDEVATVEVVVVDVAVSGGLVRRANELRPSEI